jgi:hypothetical protein
MSEGADYYEAPEKFETNLLRFIAAELYFLAAMNASREMHGKSYFALGVGEKSAVDQVVLATVAGNYQAVTEELLAGQSQPATVPGFQPPPSPPSAP